MKVLVLYDSAYGNTAKVAQAITAALSRAHKVILRQVQQFRPADLDGVDLFIVGSPTQGGRPTPSLQKTIDKLPPNSLNHSSVAAFDKRFAERSHGLGLRLVMKTVGFAAGRIARALEVKGGWLVTEPEGFIVTDKEGPLQAGELVRAAAWAKNILARI